MGISGFVVDRYGGREPFLDKAHASVQAIAARRDCAGAGANARGSGSVELQTQNQSPLQAAGYTSCRTALRSDTSVAKLNSCELRS